MNSSYIFLIIGILIFLIVMKVLTKRDNYQPVVSATDFDGIKSSEDSANFIILKNSPYRGLIAPCYDPELDNYSNSQVFIGNIAGALGCGFNNEQWVYIGDRIILHEKRNKCLSVNPESKIVYLANVNDQDVWQHWKMENGYIIPKADDTKSLSLFPHTDNANKRSVWIYTIMTGEGSKYQQWKFM